MQKPIQKPIRVALIGLDTSHTVEFARRMQAPDCPDDQKVSGLAVVSCLRFATPFQSEAGLNERQATLEGWGIKVTTDFDEAIENCDALMLEINDPAYHAEYFARCAELGKPIFLDKPLADNLASGRAIVELAEAKSIPFFSASSLRFVPQLEEACRQMPTPQFVHVFGPLGQAPSGSSVVWYGVHSFEMLQRALGSGAKSVRAFKDENGVTAIVSYADNRRGVVELNNGAYVYGGSLRDLKRAVPFMADMTYAYRDLLLLIEAFLRTGQAPLSPQDTLEIMALLEATERALQSGREEAVS
jgi:predicted dehydrogenase